MLANASIITTLPVVDLERAKDFFINSQENSLNSCWYIFSLYGII